MPAFCLSVDNGLMVFIGICQTPEQLGKNTFKKAIKIVVVFQIKSENL